MLHKSLPTTQTEPWFFINKFLLITNKIGLIIPKRFNQTFSI